MQIGVVLLNFGEPTDPDPDLVRDYLERIFLANASLEDDRADEIAHERAATLAKRRTPGLLEEYETIGGSPLNAQARQQAESLEKELRARGFDVQTFLGTQYTEPLVADAVKAAYDAGVDRLIGLPVYPLCGPSTTVMALEDLDRAVADLEWGVDVDSLTGWHRYPPYARLRADNIRSVVESRDIDLTAEETALVFSAHGTPLHYLEKGSRYDRYVREHCEIVGGLLGGPDYQLGYQNHESRNIPWTEPDVEDLVAGLDEKTVVVEPISFLHEQSETLYELDVELAEEAIGAEQTLVRVPIPHADERIPALFADLLEPLLAGFDPEFYQLRQCQCRNEMGTYCLNAPRE